jgi:hypothetical protein
MLPDYDRQILVVRHIALTCLQAGRAKADFIYGDDGPMGFQDWAEQQFRGASEEPINPETGIPGSASAS